MWPVTGTSYNAQEKVWSGPQLKDLYNTELTIGEAALKQMQRTPQKIIQIVDTTGEAFTAKQFSDYSLLLARNLLKLGIKFKDNVGLYAQNSTHVATVMMASFLCGTPVNALFPGFDKDTVVSLYKNTRPKIIYCDVENYAKSQEVNEELQLNAKIILMTGCIEGVSSIKDLLKVEEKEHSLDSFEFPCANMTSSDTAVILCSSGTTGTPKGVMCSHHALLQKNVYLSATNDSVFFCFSTMYWASGLLNLVAALLNSNLRIVTDKPSTPEYFLYLVKRYNITHSFVTATQMAELVLNCSKEEIRKSLQSMDTLLCGGAKVPQPVQEKLVDILSDNTRRPGFSIIYGMSELGGGLTYNAGYPFDFGPQTEGKLVANKKVRIVDKTGQNLGPNESGEIVIYSPYAWSGYYRNPEATAKALTGQWLHSGDIGFFDDVGFLHVSGRDKDMFKTKNFQICPQPIEDVIMRVPGVAEVCVFPVPDFVAENLVACAIVRTKGSEGVNLTAAMVHEFVQQNVDSVYHLKGGIYFVAVIPKTGSGKMQRQKVAAMFNAKNDHLDVDK